MRGIRNSEGLSPAMGGQESALSPAMREWRRKLDAGYTIRPRLRVGERGYVVWGPGLFNPEGAFVQNVRRDTMRKLMRLGLLTDDGRGVGAAVGMDANNGDADIDASDVAPVDSSGRCVDRDSE